jgi:Bacterial Ig-like domain (group 3)
VDYNVAPVISYSYGTCEAANGTAGNQFYYTLWEQAAAEGITVAIATGDTGSAGCDDSSTETAATSGVAVGGTSSTPYNVAVGGTDFIPTSTTTAASTYWGSTNNATTAASALSYIPETPWNDSTCATQYPTMACTPATTGDDLTAGSGGPSNCVQSTTNSSGNVICTTNNKAYPNGGYPKPSWQIGIKGMPNDSVRDQPDVSFFASNGGNGVAYVTCQSDANTGTGSSNTSCDLNSPYLDFQLVGGTSAATPAFAAVMALVNQAIGQRQGNANYVLYALAANDANYAGGSCNSATPPLAACVFNDVVQASNSNGVEWNNSVACVGGSPNCSQSSASLFGILVLNNTPAFVAGAQYDLATGLGSLNVGNLLTKWSSASRTPTMTALSNPNPTTPTSGGNFTVTVTVTATSGTPTGDVSLNALASDGVTIVGSFGPFTLSGGTVNASTTLLPPGAALVSATYGGDATHAGSTSNPPTALAGPVAGAGKSSKTTVGVVTFDSSGNPSTPATGSIASFVYGSTNGYYLNIAVQDASGNPCSFNYPNTKPATSVPCPTGTITLFDGTSPLNDFPKGTQNFATNVATLNNNGVAQDQPINLNVGTHSITAVYSGDKNFSGSTSTPVLTLTLTQATTKTAVASSLGAITSGASVTLSTLVTTPSGGNGPTGNVTFTNGTTSLGMGTCTSTSGTSNPNGSNGTTPGTAFCIATLTTTISALYPVPQSRPRPPVVPIVLLATSIVAYLALLRRMPENRKRAYAYVALLVFATMAVGISGCGGGGGGGGSSTPTGKTVTINAAYAGDTNYAPSSGMTNIVVQ